MSAKNGPSLLIGVGNDFRSDDGVGLYVARLLAGRAALGLKVREQSGEGTALMAAWEGAGRVILIDAARPNGRPGHISRFEAHLRPLPAPLLGGSTHAFGVIQAIEMARALGRLPEELIIYAIEGQDFDHGQSLTSAVAAAAAELVERLVGGGIY